MSDYENRIGKIRLVTEGQQNVDTEIDRLLEGQTRPSYYDDNREWFIDTFDTEYHLEDDKLYQILEEKQLEDGEDIYEATKNDDGTISYHLRYYNGGCGFGEAMSEALSNIK